MMRVSGKPIEKAIFRTSKPCVTCRHFIEDSYGMAWDCTHPDDFQFSDADGNKFIPDEDGCGKWEVSQ